MIFNSDKSEALFFNNFTMIMPPESTCLCSKTINPVFLKDMINFKGHNIYPFTSLKFPNS